VLVAQSRAADRIFRFGGEEFLVIFHATVVPEAALVIERYAQSWRTHVSGLSFSAGVTSLTGDCIRRADELLYRAKRDGRNRVIVDGDLDGTSEVPV
jgi:diguanylate cyclase (GGDEF)-like protein